MRAVLHCVVVSLTLLAARGTFALTQDWGGAEDDWSMPTTIYRNPEPMRCTAKGSSGQRCRMCYPQYDDWGYPTGKIVCAAVSVNASCNCEYTNQKCAGVGTCAYTN
jgi:hypothetical protein